jgi:hypothetical protein
MRMKWLIVMGAVAVGSLGLSASNPQSPTGPSFYYCHNGRIVCCDEINQITAHDTHVTNGQQCQFIGSVPDPCPK